MDQSSDLKEPDWGAAVDSVLHQQASELRNNVHSAVTSNPDQVAQARSLARLAGVPAATAENQPDTLRRQVAAQSVDADTIARKFPNLAQFMGNVDNVRLMHDDIPRTAAVEAAASSLPQGPTPLLPDLWTGVQSTTLKVLGAWDKAAVSLSDVLPEGTPGKMTPEERAGYLDRGQFMQGQGMANTPQRWTGQVASGLSYAPFAAAAPLVVAGTEGTARTQQLMEQGVDEATANKAGAIEGGIQGAVQLLPMGNLVFGQGARRLAASTVGATLKAGAVGAAQSVASDTTTSALLSANGFGPLAAQYAPTVEKAWESALFMAGLHLGVQGAHRLIEGAPPVPPSVIEEGAAAARAEAGARAIAALGDASTASKLRERDPQSFKQFVSDSTGQASPDVYIDAKQLTTVLDQSGITPEQLRAQMPAVADQLPDALATEGQVRIPVEDYATNIAGGPVDAAIRDHLRIDPDGMTFAEARAFQDSDLHARLMEEAKQALGSTNRAPTGDVESALRAQLDQANRFPSDVNAAYARLGAQFYGTAAERMGITPEELMQRYPLAIRSEALPGARTLAQGEGEARGQISFGEDITKSPSTIALLKGADLSTFLHEGAHFFLEVHSDLASRAEAPPEVRADAEALMKWLGAGDVQSWRALPLEQRRAHHEQFARGFEKYLMEGKAPTPELQGLFGRFRSWLLSVYRSLSGINVELTPEVRSVMDRMLASESAIKQAERVRGMQAFFKTAPDGMNPSEWAEYQRLGKEATAEAVDQLQARSIRDMQWLSNAKSRALRELQHQADTQRKAIRSEVTAEVDAMPAFAAKRFLRENKGVDPEVVADKFGFSSAQEMLQAITDHGSRTDAIAGLVDQRMLERHGDLTDPDSLQRAAEAAIHNDARGRFVAAEVRALEKATGKPSVMTPAAKELAAGMVARTPIASLRPAQYEAAEKRAARAAEQALARNDIEEAATQKRAQLLNFHAAREAQRALDEVDKGLAYQGKFDRDTVRKNLQGEFLARIDDLRAMVDFRKDPSGINRPQEALLTWADGLRKLGYEPQIADWLAELATPRSYKKLTVEEFRGAIAALRSIEHIARDQKTAIVNGKTVELSAVVDSLEARMSERGERFTAEQLLEPPTARTDGYWAVLTHWLGTKMRLVDTDLKPQEFKFNRYDLHELDGPFREALLDPMLEANYLKADLTKSVSDSASKVGAELGKDWQRSLYDLVPNRLLHDPDLGTADKPVALKITRGRMLGIARHVGNESNFEKLTRGYGWHPADVWRFLQENMTAKDWRAVQAHWDSFDPLWEKTEAMIQRLGGVPPPKVPARRFSIRSVDGQTMELRGGYSPIDYDPIRSKLSVRKGEFTLDAGDRVGEMTAYRATTTRNGSLTNRAQGYTDRVSLDFHSSDSRIRDTIHDLAYREPLLNATKIVNDATFREKFMRTYGREEYQALTTWLKNVRDTNVEDPRTRGFDKAMQYTRQGVVLTGIGYRVSTVLKHGGAAALKSLGYLGNAEGAKFFAARVARMASGHAGEDIAAAREKFGEIRTRMLQMDRDYKEGTRSMFEPESWRAKNDRFGHVMVAWSDALSAVPTAWAAYDLARTSGVPKSMGGTGVPMTETEAVKYANSVVRQAHGSALEVTRSNFMQARGAKGFFGALYGFMNNTYGQLGDLLDKSVSGGHFKNNPAVAARLFATLIVPALWTQWLKDSGPGDDQNGMLWVLKAMAGEVGATVPFVRDAVSLLEYGRGGVIAPMQALTDVVNSGKDLWQEAQGNPSRIVQDLSNAVGEWAHIAGLGQLGHILQYMRDVHEGKKSPQNPAQAVKEAVVGGAQHH